MDWLNVDLNSEYESSQTFLDGYSFDQLLLEIECNMKEDEKTPANILRHAKLEMSIKVDTAIEIIRANMAGIINQVTKTEYGSPSANN